MYSIYTDSVCLWGGWGGVELCCRPYSAGVLHSVSDQFQNLQNCFTTPNKMTSKENIKGLVSLKFLRPWGEGWREGKGTSSFSILVQGPGQIRSAREWHHWKGLGKDTSCLWLLNFGSWIFKRSSKVLRDLTIELSIAWDVGKYLCSRTLIRNV